MVVAQIRARAQAVRVAAVRAVRAVAISARQEQPIQAAAVVADLAQAQVRKAAQEL